LNWGRENGRLAGPAWLFVYQLTRKLPGAGIMDLRVSRS